MKKLALVQVVLFILALGAGAVTTLLAERLAGHSAPAVAGGADSHAADHSALVDELQLTPVQRDQMRTIWEGVQTEVQGCFDRTKDLNLKRDDAIAKILTEPQKAQFEAISQDFKKQFDSVKAERTAAFQDAVQQTKLILNETQRKKYDEIIKDRLGRSALGGNSSQPTTQPEMSPLP